MNEYPSRITDTVASGGVGLSLVASATLAREDRSGDHASYRLELSPHEGFLAESVLVWEFSGEMEKRTAIDSLRRLAEMLDAL